MIENLISFMLVMAAFVIGFIITGFVGMLVLSIITRNWE